MTMTLRSTDHRGSGAAALLLAFALGGCALAPQPQLYGELDEADVALAAAAMQHALESAPDGESRRWSNTASGRAGRVTPVRTVLTETGEFCRDYEEELRVGERSATYTHRACRDPRGRWIWL
jgi:surface antigen